MHSNRKPQRHHRHFTDTLRYFGWFSLAMMLGCSANSDINIEMDESKIAKAPAEVSWSVDAGKGFAGPVVDGDVLYFYHRIDERDAVQALDRKTGKEIWKYSYLSKFSDGYRVGDGPRCAPIVGDGRVFVYAADGQLHGLNAKDGKPLWALDTVKQYDPPEGFFGVGASPILLDGVLMVNIGAKGAAVVGFDPATGKELWKSGDDAAGYSTPRPLKIGEESLAVFFTRAGLMIVQPKDGKIRWTYPWRSRLDASVNAAAPIVQDKQIFLTASYGTGAVLLNLLEKEVEEEWSNDKSMSCHFNTPVRVGKYLYGVHGRHEGSSAKLRCIDWNTGEIAWSEDRFGCAHLIANGPEIIAVTDDGQLVRFSANEKEYKELSRKRIDTGMTRSLPALSDGQLYVRSQDTLYCISVKE